jgi:hypothetical protein
MTDPPNPNPTRRTPMTFEPLHLLILIVVLSATALVIRARR